MIKAKDQLIEGTEVTMGGTTLTIPALNMRQIKALRPQIIKMDKETDPDKKLAATFAVILQAIRRNYPEATEEDLDELIDMNNLAAITMAVMGQSGFEKNLGKFQPAEEA